MQNGSPWHPSNDITSELRSHLEAPNAVGRHEIKSCKEEKVPSNAIYHIDDITKAMIDPFAYSTAPRWAIRKKFKNKLMK